MTFEEIFRTCNVPFWRIEENGAVVARGIHMTEPMFIFKDNNNSFASYSDTGIFILLKGSRVHLTDRKYKKCIGTDQRTTSDIIFQSRNAAAQFVLGDKGRTNHWKRDTLRNTE